MIVDIIVTLILIFSFIGGLKNGAVKELFSVLCTLIAIFISGAIYRLPVSLLQFISDFNWRSLLGFLITYGIISIILFLIVLLPRKLLEGLWRGGILSSALGGIFSVMNAAIGVVLLSTLLLAYPVLPFLYDAISSSGMVTELLKYLQFVQLLLPVSVQRW
ncbi:MAG: CvpA family protein [Syntrophales bacterium]|nr:CvpA family protein [Syntrophales bacterium]